MEWWQDYKFWSFILSGFTFVGVVITALVNKITSDKIMGNHLFHIAQDLTEIKQTQKCQGNKIEEIENNISFINGRLNVKSKLIEVPEKSYRK